MYEIKAIIEILEKIDNKINNVDITLAKQAKDIEYHIKRTDLLEEKVRLVKEHVVFVKNLITVIMSLGGVIGFVAVVYAAIK